MCFCAFFIELGHIMRILSKLQSHWESQNVDPLPFENAAAIKKAFKDIGLTATTDVIALYGAIGGMGMMDNEYWRLWSLAEIGEQTASPYGAVFSDYCISCWEYRLKAVSEDISAVYIDRYDSSPPVLVAPSLESFLEQYSLNARLLLDAR
jgi:hypothetical protein